MNSCIRTGPKSDYAYHTEAMDRAMDGGIDDVGLGVLFGLNNYRYDFTGIIMHAEHLEAYKGVGPHTISVPRLRRADDIDPDVFDNGISDDMFAKIVACIRIAVPYTGMIVSTRESPQRAVKRVLESRHLADLRRIAHLASAAMPTEERPEDDPHSSMSMTAAPWTRLSTGY